MRTLFSRVFVFMVLLQLIGCTNQANENKPTALPISLARSNILALSPADSCISVVDNHQPKQVRDIKHEYFRKIQDFAILDQKSLLLPINGEMETIGKEVVRFDISNASYTITPVTDAPQRVYIGDEYSLMTHNVTDAKTPGKFEISILNRAGTQKFYSALLPGLVTSVYLAKSIAYIGIQDFVQNTQHGLLTFDTTQNKVLNFYPLKHRPTSIVRSRYKQNLLYATLHSPQTGAACEAAPSDVVEIDLETGVTRSITQFKWPGKILESSSEYLLVTEYCFEAGQHLRKINKVTGETIMRTVVGSGPIDMVEIEKGLVAVAIENEAKIVFVETETLSIQDRVDLKCRWPTTLKVVN